LWEIDADKKKIDDDLGFSPTKVFCYESSQNPPLQSSLHQTVDIQTVNNVTGSSSA
jgi:hypothetical protein